MTLPRILTIDIESYPHITKTWGLFKQDIGINQIVEPGRMMCWAAKWYDKDRVAFRSEYHNLREQMISTAWNLLDQADIVVHFNGDNYDIPNLNREFLLAGLGEPSPSRYVDLLKVFRSRFRFASNKLDYLLSQCGGPAKMHTGGMGLWDACATGDAKAWAAMRRYNIQDVRSEEWLYNFVRPWIRNHPAIGLWAGEADSCRSCGGTSLVKRGYAYTAVASFQQYRCESCGAWSRGSKAIDRVSLRAVS